MFQFLEEGLYCIEFHPEFKKNGLFYISYADMWFNGSTFIVQYKVSADDPDKADMASAKPIMRIDFPYANHHGGKIKFGPDGYLYVGVGDGGWEGDVLETGQNLGTWLGKMLRILSTQMRIDRTQRAEKLANEAPVKLLLPLIGFIFPTLFIMLFGPIAYQMFFGANF